MDSEWVVLHLSRNAGRKFDTTDSAELGIHSMSCPDSDGMFGLPINIVQVKSTETWAGRP